LVARFVERGRQPANVFTVHAYSINKELTSICVQTHSLQCLQSLAQHTDFCQKFLDSQFVIGLLTILARN
jgi:hypothetical protein